MLAVDVAIGILLAQLVLTILHWIHRRIEARYREQRLAAVIADVTSHLKSRPTETGVQPDRDPVTDLALILVPFVEIQWPIAASLLRGVLETPSVE
jgi:hypothetical protein